MRRIIVPIIPNGVDDPAVLRRLLFDYSVCLSNIVTVLKEVVEKNRYVSGGALSAYGAGAKGYDTDAHAAEIHALVVKIRAALVENGIMT